jgi:hypothetical protein
MKDANMVTLSNQIAPFLLKNSPSNNKDNNSRVALPLTNLNARVDI